MLLSSLIHEEFRCNYKKKKKAELVCSLEKLQACATRLVTQCEMCLSNGSPPIAEYKAKIELTLWHRLPTLKAQK